MLEQLKQVKNKSLTDIVEEEIRKAIISSKLKPGDKLPGELDFVEKLGVSRSVVREAIGRLRTLGVLESKKCRGIILREPDLFGQLKGVIDLPIFSSETKLELFNLRLTLEVGIAPNVFCNKTQDDIDYLESIVQTEENNAKNIDISIENDIKFHSRFYEMTGNRCIERFQHILRSFMSENIAGFNPNRFTDGSTNHRTLLDVLKKDSEDDFCNCVRKHLNYHLKTSAAMLRRK